MWVHHRPGRLLHTALIACVAGVIGMTAGSGCRRSSGNNAARLVINEVMANGSIILTDPKGQPLKDEDGNPADWVEVYNPLDTPVNLAGYTLSDNPGNSNKFRFPPLLLGPKGFVLVVLGSDPARGPLHARFRLSGQGEAVYLYARDGEELMDRRSYQQLGLNTTAGIFPDGNGEYGIIYMPTPGTANRRVGVRLPRIGVQPEANQPNPAAISMKIILQQEVGAEILKGELAWGFTDSCAESFPAVSGSLDLLNSPEVTREGPIPAKEPEYRRDVFGRDQWVPLEEFTFTAQISVLEREKVLRLRTTLGNEIGEDVQFDCQRTEPPKDTVLINEFQPRNQITLLFDRYNSAGDLVGQNETPDWIELYNYGSQAVSLADLAFVGDGTYRSISGGNPPPDLFIWRFRDVEIDLIGPGEYFLILADGDNPYFADGSSAFRNYYKAGTNGKAYRSTNFRLSGGDASQPDSFWLLDKDLVPIDSARFDFSQSPGGSIRPDVSYGRIPDGAHIGIPLVYPPVGSESGQIMNCPTPEGPNEEACGDILPRFEEAVWFESLRCPGPGNLAEILSFVAIDQETSKQDQPGNRTFEVELSYTASDGASEKTTVLSRGDGLQVDPISISDMNKYHPSAPPGTALYTIRADIPGQPGGTLVTFKFRARDLVVGGGWIEHSEDTGPEISFRYQPGYVKPPVVINEVFPNADPDDPNEEFRMDYIELFNDSGEPQDISRMFLHNQDGTSLGPYGRVRRFQFQATQNNKPVHTIIEPYGFLCVYFPRSDEIDRVPQGSPYVPESAFSLDDCTEALYLLAPDEDGNCTVSEADWYLIKQFPQNPDEPPVCAEGISAVRIPDGNTKLFAGSALNGKEPPTPCASNCPEIAIHGFEFYREPFHYTGDPGNSMECVERSKYVIVQAVVQMNFLQMKILGIKLSDLKAELHLERDGGKEVLQMKLEPLEDNPCLLRRKLSYQLSPPHSPVNSYRVRFTYGEDQVLESEQYTFGISGSKPPLVINELIAVNQTYPDEQGNYPSWIELFNNGIGYRDFGGMYLTDNLEEPRKWQIPRIKEAVVPPWSYLIVFADGEAENPDDLHANFIIETNIDKTLYLLDKPERGTCILDKFGYNFIQISPGRSLGRFPNGTGDPPRYFDHPTPGRSNSGVPREFIRGDVMEDGRLNLTDYVWFFKFLQGDPVLPRPPCEKLMDVNDDGQIDQNDGIYLGEYLFLEGPVIPQPFPEPGMDPTEDNLDCP